MSERRLRIAAWIFSLGCVGMAFLLFIVATALHGPGRTIADQAGAVGGVLMGFGLVTTVIHCVVQFVAENPIPEADQRTRLTRTQRKELRDTERRLSLAREISDLERRYLS